MPVRPRWPPSASQDPAELLNIAVKTDHKDAGIGALERARHTGGDLDRAIRSRGSADRAKNKSVGKRARAMVQAIDDAEAAQKAALEQHQQRVAGAIARVEALAASTTLAGAEDQLRDAERGVARARRRARRTRSPRPTAAASTRRCRRPRGDLEREAPNAPSRNAREAELTAARGARTSMCERVEALHGEDALDRLAEARSEWEGLPADPEAATHERSWRASKKRAAAPRRATRTAQDEREDQQPPRGARRREAEQLAAQEDSPAYAWDAISREWRALREKTEWLDDAVQQRYTAAEDGDPRRAPRRRRRPPRRRSASRCSASTS